MLWTFSVHTAIYIKKGSVINVVCYERVCYEHGLLWKWSVFNRSVMNVVCFEWSVMNGSILNGNLSWSRNCSIDGKSGRNGKIRYMPDCSNARNRKRLGEVWFEICTHWLPQLENFTHLRVWLGSLLQLRLQLNLENTRSTWSVRGRPMA